MDTQQEFEALMQSATEQADMTRMQFISKNPDMLDVMNKGIRIR